MFEKHSQDGYNAVLEGIERKTLVYGKKTLMSEFVLKKGSILHRHAHPHEQTGYLVKGRMRVTVGTEIFDVREGDSWCIPGDTEHGSEIIEDSVAVEVFSPVREDYLPEDGNEGVGRR